MAICRAVINGPAVVFADEPTGNLDSASGERILSLLVEMVRTSGTTLVVATHSDAIVRRADTFRWRDLRKVNGRAALEMLRYDPDRIYVVPNPATTERPGNGHWCAMRLRTALTILTALRDDPSDYVRRSVANALNDIGKDHPDLVAGIVAD